MGFRAPHAPVYDGAIDGDMPKVLAVVALHFLNRLDFLKRNFLVKDIFLRFSTLGAGTLR